MPAQILHTLFGEDLIAELSRRMPQGPRVPAWNPISGEYREVFTLGCQGPDIFYHAQMSKPVGLEYGALLHRRGYGACTGELFRLSGERDHGAYGAYALGFMSHAFLDRAAHPYIIYKAGWVSPGNPETAKYAGAHAFFERILDALMLEYLRGKAVSSWDQETLRAEVCADPPQGLKDLLAETLIRAFPGRAGKDSRLKRRVDNTFTDCAAFYAFTAPRLTSFRKGYARGNYQQAFLQDIPPILLHPERLSLEPDYLNLGRRVWHYPVLGGAEDRRSFPELYWEAVMAAAEALEESLTRWIMEGRLSPEAIAGAIGGQGLSVQDADGRPCAPSLADPLPLDLALERQRRLRGQ
jgi:hypothetical protein